MEVMTNLTVSTDWLFANRDNKNLVILDASIKRITGSDNQPVGEKYIPNSVLFDLKNEMSDQDSPYSHTLLPNDKFVENLRKLGVDNDSVIVVYDNQGIYSSPRAFYMIKNIGHVQVYVLDGGLPEWEKKGYPVESFLSQPKHIGNIEQRGTHEYFNDTEMVLKAMNEPSEMIIDARSAARFSGEEAEPRKGLKSGHIPGSYNMPFEEVLNEGKFHDITILKKQFDQLGVENKKLIFSCGSGVTSCILALAAELCGYQDIHVYDGSWTEWADEENSYPVVL